MALSLQLFPPDQRPLVHHRDQVHFPCDLAKWPLRLVQIQAFICMFAGQDANALSPAVQQAVQLPQPPSCVAFPSVAIHGPIKDFFRVVFDCLFLVERVEVVV